MRLVRERISETGLSFVYANMAGAQDELIFDGASFAMNRKGELTHQFDEFTETLGLIELQNGGPHTRENGPIATFGSDRLSGTVPWRQGLCRERMAYRAYCSVSPAE